MSEAERISFDVERMFPEAVRRAKVLEQIKRSWSAVVDVKIARHSYPYDLSANKLWVAAENETAKSMLSKSAGTVARRIAKRFGYVFAEPFALVVTNSPPVPKKTPEKKRPVPEVTVDEEKVRQYMQGAPDTLPEDINYALSHLKAFMEARFPAPRQEKQ